VRALALLGVLACAAPRPSPSWIEHDVHDTQPHAVTPPRADRAGPGRGGVALDAAAVDRMTPAELARAWPSLDPAGAPAAAVALRLALVAEHTGDRAAAATWLERARAASGDAATVAAAAALGKRLGGPVRAGALAVLLPLSGRHARLGAEARAAIELALAGRRGVTWLDTTGDEAQAAAQVDRAVDAGAVAILGPIGEREGLAAARRAAERGIPIGLVAPADGADPAAGVFRLATSPADEARAAAQLAAELDYATVAVLAPRDDVGAAMAAAFATAARAAGLTVAAEGSYDPTARSLEPEVKAFLGLVPATNPRLRTHLARHGKTGWQTFSPDIPFSLLYVPDQHDRAALVASFLPYLGVELRTSELVDPLYLRRKHRGRIPQVVQMLGSSGWNHPGLVPRGGSAVEGALIVDVHAGDLEPAAGGDFAARFAAATGRAPSAVAAQAHDAALLISAALTATAEARDPRAAMRGALSRAAIDDGACGAARVGAAGEVERAPVVLEVEGGEIVVAPY
jgi:branched-chain amino acid transport system substrate-binding protein